MVVIQMSSCVQDILWVATTTKTKNYNVSVIRSNREDKYHTQMKSPPFGCCNLKEYSYRLAASPKK